MTIPPAMVTAEAMNFQDAGSRRIAATGDLLDDSPRLFYVHWRAVYPMATVAGEPNASLDHIHTRQTIGGDPMNTDVALATATPDDGSKA
jgi:hypothetical protein